MIGLGLNRGISISLYTPSMKTIKAKLLTDAKAAKTERRFRNILANSGEIMESGEIRDIQNLYVMDYDGNLIRIADLDTNPDKQTEKYAVKAQADHGELIDGELVPSIEKQFGSCKVWLEDDGLHARMYFANDDALADHAWAISEDASYSTGIHWYPDGYYGVDKEIPEAIGILREISMVLTGNDPRAKTIDTKPNSEAQRSEDGDGEPTKEKEKDMSKDALTPDEQNKLVEELVGLVERFTTKAPEDETEPTAADTKDAEGEVAEAPAETETEAAPAEEAKEEVKEEAAPTETKDNIKHMPVVVVKDQAVKQEITKVESKKDWLTSKDGHIAFASCLKQAGKFGGQFDALWRAEASKHMSLDGISGLPTPAPIQSFENAVAKADGILSKLTHVATKAYRANILTADATEETGRAHGHKKGDTKANQVITDTTRDVLCKMVYKKLDLDALELWENPELIDFRSQELVESIIREIERAAIIGDGRTYTSGADYRMFDGTRGFYSIAADAAAGSGYGSLVTSTISTTASQGYNLRDKVVLAKGQIKTEGRQFLVVKQSLISDLLLAKTSGNGYLVQPGASLEDLLQVSAIYAPSWMDLDETNDAYLIVEGAYKTIGDTSINTHADFDTSTNVNVLLDETPRGGSLDKYKSAVAIAVTGE